MPQTINTNVMSLNSQRNLNMSQNALATSMQRLSSGMRVNSARDDAAGLAVAERMNTQVRGASVAVRNANDGISLLQTVEGALSRVADNMQRMREIAVQSANEGVIGSIDRGFLQQEVTQLQLEIARIVDNSKFNGVLLFDSSFPDPVTFQVGPDSTDTIDISTTSFNMTTLNTYAGADITDPDASRALMDQIDADLAVVNSARASSGAAQSRFEAIVVQLQVYGENTSSARGRIMDADYAVETANAGQCAAADGAAAAAGGGLIARRAAARAPTSTLKFLPETPKRRFRGGATPWPPSNRWASAAAWTSTASSAS
jgi:flagellin